MGRFEHLRIRQLDSALLPFRDLLTLERPPGGWIKAIRQGLGMSLRQFGDRLGSSKTAAATLERNEASEVIQLGTLEAAARALDCELVYALVPRGSLQSTVRGQIDRVAREQVRRVSETMALEDQAIGAEEQERQVDALAEELWETMPRGLWDATS